MRRLPAELTSFVGRAGAVATLRELLDATRLLTLTGVGGCGKTRLALRVAADVAPLYRDGVALVDLASLADPGLVPHAVATALGVRASARRPLLATLAAATRTRRLLLVLDNCEHLVGSCARLVEALLRAGPNLRVLCTSREPLRVPGEVVWRVPSLAVPRDDPLPLETLAQIEAVALFLDRARAHRPEFRLATDNALAVAAICRQLHGLPLALELAAAQLGALTAQQVAERLHQALALLGGGNRTLPRQETLRATLDWSHALLSEGERVLFRRLGAFAGSFTLEAAEEVCTDEVLARSAVLPALTGLVTKSLLEAQVHGPCARYRLLEPVRQYAVEMLAASGELAAVRRRHARFFLQLAEAAEPKLMSGQRGPWQVRLEAEQDNLRHALAWCTRPLQPRGPEPLDAPPSDAEAGLRLAGALFWFWNVRGEVNEGLGWAEAAITTGQGAPPAARAKALYAAGEMAWLLGNPASARAWLDESAALWRNLGQRRALAYVLQVLAMVATSHESPGPEALAEESRVLFIEVADPWGLALAVFSLGLLAMLRDDGAAAQAWLSEALARFRAVGDEWFAAHVLNSLGDLAQGQGHYARAVEHYQASLVMLRRWGGLGSIPSVLHNLGHVALQRGDAQGALGSFCESLALFRRHGDQRGVAECLAGVAAALGALRQARCAVRLFGAAEALLDACGAVLPPANRARYARNLAAVRMQLGDADFRSLLQEGRALPEDEAVAFALHEARGAPAQGEDAGAPLTPREREVARLIARGATNRAIAEDLVISEETAASHVKHILAKLGFATRAQVAAWAAQRGLMGAAAHQVGSPPGPLASR